MEVVSTFLMIVVFNIFSLTSLFHYDKVALVKERCTSNYKHC